MDLPVPVVLGQELLDSIAAFTYHTEASIDINIGEDLYPDMKTIQVVSRISRAIRRSRKKGAEAADQITRARSALAENDAQEIHRQEATAKEIFCLEKMEASTSNPATEQLYKQQKEGVITRNNVQIATYDAERKKGRGQHCQVMCSSCCPLRPASQKELLPLLTRHHVG